MDFRLKTDFLDHPKFARAQRELGAAGVVAVLRLYGFAAANRPAGALTELSDDDVELIARWPDERRGELLRALLALRLLDRDESGTLVVHDWAEHQPFLIDAEARREQARTAARTRWNRRAGISTAAAEPPRASAAAASSSRVARRRPDPEPPEFANFYDAFPRHQAREAARRAWRQLNPDAQLIAAILSDLGSRKAGEWRGVELRFIPLPARYLNGRRWQDAPLDQNGAARPTNGSRNGNHAPVVGLAAVEQVLHEVRSR